jgi:hypothetical protein
LFAATNNGVFTDMGRTSVTPTHASADSNRSDLLNECMAAVVAP